MSALYEKLRSVLLTNAATPIATATESDELAIANEPLVTLHVGYTAQGTGKTLRLYPEVRVSIAGVADLWLPAVAAVPDVAGASVDGAGYLPLPIASPIYEVAGIDGEEVLVAVDVPVRAGDRFRVRFLEDGYNGSAPGEVTLIATPARGAT